MEEWARVFALDRAACGRPGSMWSGRKHLGRGFRGFRSVCVGNGRYLGKYLRSDGLFIVKR